MFYLGLTVLKTGFQGTAPSSLSTNWRHDLHYTLKKQKKKKKKKSKKSESSMVNETYVFVSSRLGNSLLVGLRTDNSIQSTDKDNNSTSHTRPHKRKHDLAANAVSTEVAEDGGGGGGGGKEEKKRKTVKREMKVFEREEEEEEDSDEDMLYNEDEDEEEDTFSSSNSSSSSSTSSSTSR